MESRRLGVRGGGGTLHRASGTFPRENQRGCWCPGVWALSLPDAASASISLSPIPRLALSC